MGPMVGTGRSARLTIARGNPTSTAKGQTETSARPCAMSVLPSGADFVRLHLANDARPRKAVFWNKPNQLTFAMD